MINDFDKCKEHKEYDEIISLERFQEILMTEYNKNPDTACDEDPADYGYAYCNECDKLIRVD